MLNHVRTTKLCDFNKRQLHKYYIHCENKNYNKRKIMDLREALGRSTMHALPRAIKSRSIRARMFWCSVFLVANLILGYHLFRLLNRFLQRDVSTTFRIKYSDTLFLPVIYIMLFDVEKIVSNLPHKVLNENSLKFLERF